MASKWLRERMAASQPVALRRGFFWVGIEPVVSAGGTILRAPMHVCWEAPVENARPYPIVLVHGGGGQATDWMGTPDGRPGWMTGLVQDGWTTFAVDRPAHGRSSWQPDQFGKLGASFTAEAVATVFAGSSEAQPAHTQWPGDERRDDPAVEQLLASSCPMIRDFGVAHALEQQRGAELLDRIGPAVVITHSAGAPMGWLMADVRPELIKALIAIEPLGPPFVERPDLGVSLDWGLTAAPLTFDPPVSNASELSRPPTAPNGLPTLARVPLAVVAAEASPRAAVTYETVAYLRAAGCQVDHLPLGELGVHGNGHAMMLERNSTQVLGVLLEWLSRRL